MRLQIWALKACPSEASVLSQMASIPEEGNFHPKSFELGRFQEMLWQVGLLQTYKVFNGYGRI